MVANNIVKASILRDKINLRQIPESPGYYIWWAKKEQLDSLLTNLNVDFNIISTYLNNKQNTNGEVLYAIYVGIAVAESVRDRIDWHINDKHTSSRVKNRTLSTLRQSISSVLVHDQYDKQSTDEFMEKLYVEYIDVPNKIGSIDAKTKLPLIEKNLMKQNLYILNIKDNKHPNSNLIKPTLRKLRKDSRYDN